MVSLKVLFELIIIICLNKQFIEALRSFDIRWVRTNCSVMDRSHVSLLNCTINELPRNRGNYLTADVTFNRDIYKMIMDFSISMLGKGKNKRVNLLQFRTDLCHLSSFQSKNPVVNAISKRFLQSGNFPKQCPVKKNFTYAVEHFVLNPDYLPDYTPEINFSTKLSLYAGNADKLIIFADLEARVIKKKK